MKEIAAFFAPAGPLIWPIVACSFGILFCFLRSRDLLNSLGPTDPEPSVSLRRARRHEGLLAALTVAAPLLGLLGTVSGMMTTFDAVSMPTGAADTTERISGGISQALLTTQVGLVVAIPGYFGLARVRRLADHARNRMTEGAFT